jgi:hypothetical protein
LLSSPVVPYTSRRLVIGGGANVCGGRVRSPVKLEASSGTVASAFQVLEASSQ